MKNRCIMFMILFSILINMGCEKTIDPELLKAPEVTIIDAWINDKTESQVINIRKSLPFFDASELPGIQDAEVQVIREDGSQFLFIESETQEGAYVWRPDSVTENIGIVGDRFVLDVKIDDIQYASFSQLNRVPDIDSITFKLASDNPLLKGSYLAEFWSVDFDGTGDTYWIKAFKNGVYLSKPSEINIAWDAGFSRGDKVDGVAFNKFIRTGVNPYDEDDHGEIISPYIQGDSLYVEIHSITNSAYSYLFEVSVQTNRPGGFAEIFAVPLANVSTNIINITNDEVVTGFFSVSSVKSLGKRFVEEN